MRDSFHELEGLDGRLGLINFDIINLHKFKIEMIPDYLVHYYLPDKQPFQNLSELLSIERELIVKALNKQAEEGCMKRAFPDWYFPQREEAEKNLLESFIKLGGDPERKSPHYFCLGESIGMEFFYNKNFKQIIAPIEELNCQVMYSIGDTLWTFAKSHNPDQKWENKWYQGKLYTYEETVEIVKKLNLDLKSKDSLNSNQVFHIEALVWSDKEVQKLISKT